MAVSFRTEEGKKNNKKREETVLIQRLSLFSRQRPGRTQPHVSHGHFSPHADSRALRHRLAAATRPRGTGMHHCWLQYTQQPLTPSLPGRGILLPKKGENSAPGSSKGGIHRGRLRNDAQQATGDAVQKPKGCCSVQRMIFGSLSL